MTVHLVRGDDPVLRDEALTRLVDELVGDDDRTLAVEELTVPGRAAAAEATVAETATVANPAGHRRGTRSSPPRSTPPRAPRS